MERSPLESRGAPATPEEIAGLGRIQTCRKLLWLMVLALAPTFYFASRGPDAVVIVASLLIVGAFGGVLLTHYLSRCPRCRELFNVTRTRHVWASECVHCGLSLGTQESVWRVVLLWALLLLGIVATWMSVGGR
jgi:hypothetical protein